MPVKFWQYNLKILVHSYLSYCNCKWNENQPLEEKYRQITNPKFAVKNSSLKEALHTTYRKNNNLEKCAGMGLNGFQIRSTFGTQDTWKNENPGSPLGATS